MAKPEWGTKRICQSCGAKYYDLLRPEIVCPKCGAVFDPDALLRSRRVRPGGKPVAEVAEPKPKPVAAPVEAEAEAEEEEELEELPADDEDLEELVEDEAEDDELIEDASELGDDDDMGEVVIDDDKET